MPCKFKLASGSPSTFGQSNQPIRRAPATRIQLVTRSMSSNTEMKQGSQTDQRTGGSSWIGNGAVLALGGALPGLLVAWKWDEIGKVGHAYQSLSVVSVDALFILVATAFISTGDTFGTQRYGVFPKYPGPFKELDGSLFPPSYFKTYVASTPLALGIIMPVVALAYMLWQHDTELAISTLGVYLVEVAAQLISERVYIQKESVMWPQVPQVYQTYRIWQLIRGCYLTSLVGEHDWLWAMQAGLILLWVFNFGAVMTWTPWMYRWQLQPEGQEHNSSKIKSK